MARALMAGADGTLYAAVDGQVAPLSSRDCVFVDRRTGRSHLLPNAAVGALDACRAFAPLAAHAQHLAALQPALAPAAIAQGLDFLVTRGLLCSDREFLHCTAASGDGGPLRAVFVRACDRPAQLARLLASLAANEAAHRGAHRYVVLDDSRDPAAVREHARLVAEFAAHAGVAATHVEDSRWTQLVERLGAPAPAAARIALSRDAAGRARFGGGKGYNLAALLGAGARYALLDDDFELPLKRPHYAEPGLDLADVPDSPARFHDTVEAAVADGFASEGDPFEQARALVGSPLGAIWARDAFRVTPASLLGFAPSLAKHVTAQARVATLTHGHRGASGAPSSRWMYLLDAASRQDFAADAGRYARNLAAAAVWYGPRRARVDLQTTFTPFAVDARGFVPPTRAEGRGEDQLFGALQAACDPASVALHTNLTIGHRQEGVRDRVAVLDAATTPGTNQWLAELLRNAAHELAADTAPARARALANTLRDVAAATPSRRRDLVAGYVRFARADMASRLAAVREAAADAPDHWKRDVDRMIEVHRRALIDDTAPRLADAAASADADDALREDLEAQAEVLAAWPLLFDHAARCAETLLQE